MQIYPYYFECNVIAMSDRNQDNLQMPNTNQNCNCYITKTSHTGCRWHTSRHMSLMSIYGQVRGTYVTYGYIRSGQKDTCHLSLCTVRSEGHMSMLTALRIFSVIFSVLSPQSGMPLKRRFRRREYCSILFDI